MSADFEISLPNWPFNGLLAEACGAYNLHRPEGAQEADPSHSEWPLLCGVVHSYIRHNLTEYDSVLSVAGGDEALREELHKKISAAAHRAYPWLRGCLKSPDSVIFHRLCFPIPASKQPGRTLVRVP